MLLFTRTLAMRGGPRKVMAWATEMTEIVRKKSDLGVTMWTSVFGYPAGTMGWTARVEGRAQLMAEMQKLMGEKKYLDHAEAGTDLIVSPPEDQLRRLIHGEMGDEPPPLGAAATVITATPANGRIQEAVHWGIEAADHVGKLTGLMPLFMADAYGTFGQLTWIISAPDMAGADKASELMFGDAEYMDRVKAAADLFVPGSGHQGLITRVA